MWSSSCNRHIGDPVVLHSSRSVIPFGGEGGGSRIEHLEVLRRSTRSYKKQHLKFQFCVRTHTVYPYGIQMLNVLYLKNTRLTGCNKLGHCSQQGTERKSESLSNAHVVSKVQSFGFRGFLHVRWLPRRSSLSDSSG